MKKIILILSIVSTCYSGFSQVFNSQGNIAGKVFSLGFAPTFYTSSEEFLFNFHADLKIIPMLNFYGRYGFGDNADYVGAGVRWGLGKIVNLSAGAHDFGVFGLDGSLIFSVPIPSDTRIYGGIDTDINFPKSDITTNVWVPIGVKVKMSPALSFAFEGDIGLTDNTTHLISAGIIVGL